MRRHNRISVTPAQARVHGPLDSCLRGNDVGIKALLSETVNYGPNAAVLFDVELKDGSLAQINVNQLFSDREFLNNCSREMYGHLCHRKGYMMGR